MGENESKTGKKEQLILIYLVVMAMLGVAGCAKADNSKEAIIKTFEKNEQLFEEVADYLCNFDISPYKGDINP